jgi:integrase
MNDAQIKAKLKAAHPGKFRVDRGLYFRVSNEGTGFWIFRYTIHGKRHEATLGRYGRKVDELSLSKAKDKVAAQRALLNDGNDPLAERKRLKKSKFKVVNDLAEDWLEEVSSRIKNHYIPRRIYQKEIQPFIGDLALDRVSGLDIRSILNRVKDSGRPTIANDTLTYLKQLFDHGVTLGLINHNPAIAFKTKHAGGPERSRDRVLSLEDLGIVFDVMRMHNQHFVRENFLAVALLVVLGVRKGELISLPWSEIDLEAMVWKLPSERAKNEVAIDIPLPTQVVIWLNELKIRAGDSDFVFPSRRASKNRGYISDDTLNHALTNLFGKKTGKLESSTGDVLGSAGVDYFVIHDLRRTCRTLLSKNKIRSDVAEKCLNHVKIGVEGIYNRDAFFEERIEAHQQLADQIEPLVINKG